MSYPANVSTVTVTGTWTYSDGGSAIPTGNVTFQPNTVLLDAGTSQILDIKPLVATLDGTGHISVTLMNTSDVDLAPSGWAYTVTERIAGSQRQYSAFIVGGSVDLSTLAPAVSTPQFAYILTTARGAPNGVAALDANGVVSDAQQGYGTWTSVTPLGTLTLGTPPLQTRTAPGGKTEFRGQINWNGAYVSGTAMLTLVTAQRPAVAAQLNVRWAGTGSASTLCNIDVNGNLSVASSTPAAGSTLSLDGQWLSHV